MGTDLEVRGRRRTADEVDDAGRATSPAAPTLGLARTKQAHPRQPGNTLAEQLELERDLMRELGHSAGLPRRRRRLHRQAHAKLQGSLSMATALDTGSVVAVIGSGAMGAGIAQVAATAGHPRQAVRYCVPARPRKAIADIAATLRQAGRKGPHERPLTPTHASARLQAVDGLAELADARLVVEAIVENLDVKRMLFADLEAMVGDDCILATNTSSISITAIAAPAAPPATPGRHALL